MNMSIIPESLVKKNKDLGILLSEWLSAKVNLYIHAGLLLLCAS